MGMAGVSSTHTGSFTLKPCYSCFWFASSRGSALLGPGRIRRHPSSAVPERKSSAPSLTNPGSTKHVSAPWSNNYSSFASRDCRHSLFHSVPSSHPASGPLHKFIKQETYDVMPGAPKNDEHTVWEKRKAWQNESLRLRSMKMCQKACENIQGETETDIHHHDSFLNGNDGLVQAYTEVRNNISAACLSNLKPNGFTEGSARNNLFSGVSGSNGLDISNITSKSTNIALTEKSTRIDVTVPDECIISDTKYSSQSTKRNKNVSNGSYGFEQYAVSEPCVETNGTIVAVTQTSSDRPVKTRSKKGTDVAADRKKRLLHIYDDVLLVDNISTAKNVVQKLISEYKDLVHACDTEVSKIDVKQETPVDHGDIICFSIYSGPSVDFGNGKSCIWVDVLDGESDIMMVFAPFFEDPSIKSFDCHVIENYGIKLAGFYADTMHLARLWDSSRRMNGGYSLEALTGDPDVINLKNSGEPDDNNNELTVGKISMKEIFGKNKVKKDGTDGKLVSIASVEALQREERIPWICYSALDSISTLKLFQSLQSKLKKMDWIFDGQKLGNMYDFYEKFWRPFGNLLVEMEAEGMLVDRVHLSEIEKVAIAEQKLAADKFGKWASEYCPDAKYMNVGSDTQIRQLFFGGTMNKKDSNVFLPVEKTFKVLNVDNIIEEGKKSPTKFRNIKLTKIVEGMQAEIYTASGWPSVSGDALKIFGGKIAANEIYSPDGDIESGTANDFDKDNEIFQGEETGKPSVIVKKDTSAYGTAFTAFGKGKKGRDACHAIAALCEICSIDSLISNFILPLQGNRISGKGGRIHCSLNINTETGRLSARRPNLQNPPALEKDRYKIREAFIAAPGNSLIVADYGQLELRILAHLANCQSMLDAFEAGGDFHSRTAMNMYDHIRKDVEEGKVLIEWHSQPGGDKPPAPLLKDAFASERRRAKMLNFSIAYGKTPVGLAKDWKVSVKEARQTVQLWYKERQEVLRWQEARKKEALTKQRVYTLLGRARNFPSLAFASNAQKGHIERAAINAPVQGSAADVAMCAMLQIAKNERLKELKWKLLLQVHDEVILEGPSESAEEAKSIVIECMAKPFDGENFLNVDLSVDAKFAHSWYAAK